MNVNADDFRRHFALLSDAALLAINRDELTELARTCLDEEVSSRGLNNPATEPEAESALNAEEEAEMVEIATFAFAEEVSLARGLLDSASIPCRIATTYVAMGPAEFQLLVPKEFEEQAIEVLEHEISDEELAAQAEAAGIVDAEMVDFPES